MEERYARISYTTYYTTYHTIILRNITSFYGSSCANNGKGALNTQEALPLFSPCVQFPTFSHCSPSLGPANITRKSMPG